MPTSAAARDETDEFWSGHAESGVVWAGGHALRLGRGVFAMRIAQVARGSLELANAEGFSGIQWI
jgi:hypothetical protein